MKDPEGADVAASMADSGSVPEQRAEQPSQRMRRSPPQLNFPPVRNGLDYLASVVDHLDEYQSEVTPRDVKYAVLHLQAAVEVLLKARLLAEHWTLVFTNPHDATRKSLEDATLSSVSTEKAVTRLRNIVGVPITEKEQKALKKLSDDRNKLQHFGLTDNARAVEARAGEVLDFLIHFIEIQLMPYLDEAESAETATSLAGLREGLNSINSYVRERMNRIGGELKAEGVEHRTIDCPACQQLSLVLRQPPAGANPDDGAATATCRLCSQTWDAEELVGYFNKPGQEEPTERNSCPQCDRWSLGAAVRVRSNPAKPVYFCFSCAIGFPTLRPCIRCYRPVDAAGVTGMAMCGLCEMDLERERAISDYRYTGEWEWWK
ncbi:serine/arginine repetitive matrix protein 1 [Streptomyces sp. NRRL S-1824]|uniref:serine/arginine repetitive matrix protein 1 n=1 Tax=Streptomyces sp. NRRL S-1824 TaxID=1463889 RepID=UPI00131BE38C|nr:serine/arginine repetitive matrix protein 1 [Streptomyces sp. NRRL S-1824]